MSLNASDIIRAWFSKNLFLCNHTYELEWPGLREKKKELSLLQKKKKKPPTACGISARVARKLYTTQIRLKTNMFVIIVAITFV
jgi:hypothetical protein